MVDTVRARGHDASQRKRSGRIGYTVVASRADSILDKVVSVKVQTFKFKLLFAPNYRIFETYLPRL